MRVEIYDPDVLQGPLSEEQVLPANVIRDQARAGTPTTVNYSLFDPDGTALATQVGSNTAPSASHATWWTFATPADPAPGHWEIRVDANAGGNVAGYGLRARGFVGATEVDLNMYAHSYMSYQLHAVGFRDYTVHPYMTGHCSLRLRDWDNDDVANNTSTVNVSSLVPTSASQDFNVLSPNNQWATNDTTRSTFFTDAAVRRPGIWNSTFSVSGTATGGTGTTNEGQWYFSNPNDVSGGANPTAQPQTNSWRTYLPMLDGSAPVKPSVYQVLFYESGQNPMVAGQLTQFRVSVRVENPTTRPIVFSASNLLTAFVPGGEVTFAGGVQVNGDGAGSTAPVTPGIGGSGAITWNPGVVAAGTNANLSYLINVMPAASGRVIVTGTPAANGTSATYLDETGNSLQSRATYTWGPLCELAASTGPGNNVPTPATIATISATRRSEGTVDIAWTSGVEVGVAGWQVQTSKNLDASALRGGSVAGNGDQLDGQRYQLSNVDLTAEQFYLRSIDIDGSSLVHGPYTVGKAEGVETATVDIPWNGIGANTAARQIARTLRADADARGTVQIRVRDSGIQAVAFADIDALGSSLGGTPVNELAVLKDGQPWPRRVSSLDSVFGSGDSIEFVAQAEPGTVVSYRVYTLVRDASRVRDIKSAPMPVGAADRLSQIQRRSMVEDQRGYGFSSPTADPFYLERLSAARGQPITRTVDVSTPNRVEGAEASVSLSLWGGTDYSDFADEHGYELAINGQAIAQGRFDGFTAQDVAQPVGAALLNAANQQVGVRMLADRAPFDVFYIESVALEYAALPIADGGRLDFTAHASDGDDPGVPPAEQIFGGGFDSAAATTSCAALAGGSRCWETTIQGLGNGATAYRVANNGDTSELAIGTTVRDIKVADARIWLANAQGKRQPQLVLATEKPVEATGADYLVIAHPDFVDGLGALLTLRQGQGLSTQVISTESIYAGAGGQPSADAIASYIATAAASGTRYVLLVGSESYDSAGYLGSGSIGFVPAPYRRLHPVVNFGAADSAYADVNGDRKPDVALGRFPVRTSAELQTLINKTLALDGKVTGRALFLADDADPNGYSFDNAQQDLMANLSNAWSSRRASLDSSSVADLTTLTQQESQQGLGLLHFFGHSSPTAWTSPAPGLLPPSALFAGALGNAAQPSLLIQWGCWNSYHALPSHNSVAHAWLFGPGAAGAVIGSAAITDTANDYQLSERLLRELSRNSRLGDALKAAKQDLATGNPDLVDVLLGTTLLGDPALQIHGSN